MHDLYIYPLPKAGVCDGNNGLHYDIQQGFLYECPKNEGCACEIST